MDIRIARKVAIEVFENGRPKMDSINFKYAKYVDHSKHSTAIIAAFEKLSASKKKEDKVLLKDMFDTVAIGKTIRSN